MCTSLLSRDLLILSTPPSTLSAQGTGPWQLCTYRMSPIDIWIVGSLWKVSVILCVHMHLQL